MKGPEGTHAWTVTVGAKGQIVIPKEARTLFSIQPGVGELLKGMRPRFARVTSFKPQSSRVESKDVG